MIGKVVLFGALVGVVARAHAQPARVEATVGGGTDAAKQAGLRATDRRGAYDLELSGALDSRTDRDERTGAAQVERTTGASHLHLVGALTDTSLDLAPAHASIRRWVLDGAWATDSGLVAGASYRESSGETTDDMAMPMAVVERTRHADHRFLQAYLKHTLHVIETLDVSGGFVFDDWRNLSAIETIRYGTDDQMDVKAPDVDDIQMSPELGALYRATDHVGLRVTGYRTLRPPTVGELYVPLDSIAASPVLHAESIWAGEAGPEVNVGAFSARAAGFWHEVARPIAVVDDIRTNLDHARVLGLASAASWRPAATVLASVAYTIQTSAIRDAGFAGKQLSFAPHHRATALVAVDARVATLTGGVRLLGAQYSDAANTQRIGATTLVDAMAARPLPHGLAGFVSVENLFDRRYVGGDDLPGGARTIQIGLRLDTARL